MTSRTAKPVSFETPSGTINATRGFGLIRAMGIPYASASRFNLPAPVKPGAGLIDATNPSPACPQNPVPELEALLGVQSPTLPESEACLNLSVSVPDTVSREKRPVMVWIHGGSYVAGAGDSPIFDVGPFCREQNVIVVSVTYRLGLLGFLGGYAGRPANLGLLDIIEALRWIKTNIHAFGGDPETITLFGESAGGDAIAHLMIAEGTQGLFQRTIIQSAPLGLRHDRRKMSAAMGEIAKRAASDAPVSEILHIQKDVIAKGNEFGLKGGMPFSPQYGHYPLPPEEEAEQEWHKRAAEVDLMIGNNAEETALFLYAMPRVLKVTRMPLIGKAFRRAFVRLTTQKIYGKPAAEFAQRHAKAGGNAFHYVLEWAREKTFLGACHAVDLPLLFGDWETWKHARLIEGIPRETLERDGRETRALWADFAKNGKPDPSRMTIPDVISCSRTHH